MAKTLTNLRAQTRMYLDEVTAADWTEAETDVEINAGYQELVTATMDTYEKFYVKTTNFDSVANQQEYTTADGVPTDLFKIRRLEINYDVSNSNSIARRGRPVKMDEVLRDLGNSALGITVFRNPAYFIYGSSTGSSGITIGLIPEPTRAGTNAFKIWYIPYQGDMTAASDNPNIPYPDRYAKLISLYAAAQLLRKGQQEEEVALRYLRDFEYGLEKMKRHLEGRVDDDSKRVIDVLGMDVDFTHQSSFY